jgi:peptidoglycan hydrolase-like protein with peptidoglycan-binding domain
MDYQLNFEAEPFMGYAGEGEEEFESRDHRTGRGGGRAFSSRAAAPGNIRVNVNLPRGAFSQRRAGFQRPLFMRRGPGLRQAGGQGGFGRFRGRRRRWPFLFPGGGFGGGFGFPGGQQMQEPEVVSWAQACLAQVVGPWVPQNGIMGPATQRAVRMFQMQSQLPPTGILDENTLSSLQAACSAEAGADAGAAGGTTIGG